MKQVNKLATNTYQAEHNTNKHSYATIVPINNMIQVKIYNDNVCVNEVKRKDMDTVLRELSQKGYNTTFEEGYMF
ncbi:hypothetical protein [Anaerovorax sp. IOR16]|uniref:hypothetical protein n=1 Tax=Anaerovorax sp. IOR16 TaxID=2773458 RepID=UPI0019D089E0|nr:hypothetical protein [Anaerovorax sp. IOR16]